MHPRPAGAAAICVDMCSERSCPENPCRLFARTVLASAQPGALLITGDLTDAKLKVGRGTQLEEEWQVGSALSR